MGRTQRRILVAEDNPALSKIVSFTLERAGHLVTRAENGQEAWRIAQAQQFAMVVTDFQMPGMSGRQLCELLRDCDEYRHVPIVMLTAKRYELDVDALRQSLFISHVLEKPFSPIQLAALVEEQLALSS
ncbi:MAG: response regulator [Pirellulaceae bacterium]